MTLVVATPDPQDEVARCLRTNHRLVAERADAVALANHAACVARAAIRQLGAHDMDGARRLAVMLTRPTATTTTTAQAAADQLALRRPRGEASAAVLEWLQENPGLHPTQDIADATEATSNATLKALWRLHRKGLVNDTNRGRGIVWELVDGGG